MPFEEWLRGEADEDEERASVHRWLGLNADHGDASKAVQQVLLEEREREGNLTPDEQYRLQQLRMQRISNVDQVKTQNRPWKESLMARIKEIENDPAEIERLERRYDELMENETDTNYEHDA